MIFVCHTSLKCSGSIKDAGGDSASAGVAIAIKILQFYKRELLLSQTAMDYFLQAFRSPYSSVIYCYLLVLIMFFAMLYRGNFSYYSRSCRFVPTCSEYGMQAFKKYGVIKGAILTAWRLSRCNPFGKETLPTPAFKSDLFH